VARVTEDATLRTGDLVDIHQHHRSNDFSSSTRVPREASSQSSWCRPAGSAAAELDPLPSRPEPIGSAQRALLEAAEVRWWRYARGGSGGEKREKGKRGMRREVRVRAGRPGGGLSAKFPRGEVYAKRTLLRVRINCQTRLRVCL
jgi:hypothetical protein